MASLETAPCWETATTAGVVPVGRHDELDETLIPLDRVAETLCLSRSTIRRRARDALYNRAPTRRGSLIPGLGIREVRQWHGFCFEGYEPKASSKFYQVPFAAVAFACRPR